MRRFIGIFIAGFCFAQEQPAAPPSAALEYTGKPLHIQGTCRNEDVIAAGLTCTEDEPCDLMLELANAGGTGSRFVAVGNIHTSSSTLESILLASDDGGHTWTEGHARIPLSSLDQVQFVSGEYGWVSGETMLALPRDAFFLMTEDGGKTWRRKPVFSETRVGTIDRFWFDSRNVGTMIIDRLQAGENGMRYELYETLTGGDTWTLRQTSGKPLAIERKTAPEPAVRVHAESGTRVYRIEQRNGADWQVIARFAITAGQCKLSEPAPVPAPPEEPPSAASAPTQGPKPAAPSLNRKHR